VRAAARALGVHENTVRYRLGRVAEVTGLDVRNFDALLTARLALGILDLSCEAG
jgi:DNA-binding PucR family transcriptional regulator